MHNINAFLDGKKPSYAHSEPYSHTTYDRGYQVSIFSYLHINMVLHFKTQKQ